MKKAPAPQIPADEYFQRIHNLQAKLKEHDLDAYIVHANAGNYENVRYLTGHWPLFEVGGVIVPQKGNALLLIGAEAPGFAAECCLGMENVRIVDDYGHSIGLKWEGVKYYNWDEIFDEISGGKGVRRLGMGDYAITPVSLYNNLEKHLAPGGELIRAEFIMEELRMIKSPLEQDMIRQACKINELVFEDFLKNVRPEMTEYECTGLVLESIYRHGGEGSSFPTLMYAGERTKNMIARSSHTPIGRNRIITLDFGAMYGGYASSFARVMMFGKMPQKLKDEINFTIDVHNKIMQEWAKPGVICGDIHKKYCAYFESHGYGYPPANASHGIGVFECEPPGFRKDNPYVVQENMIFANDTFFRGEQYGFRLEDCYLIGKNGNEIFTTAHLEPIEL